MKSKLKILVIIIGIIILFIVVRACNNKISNVIRDDIDNESQYNEQKKFTELMKNEIYSDWGTGIYNLFKGKYEWNEFPLSKNFLQKYKTLEDIVPGKIKHIFGKDADTFNVVDDSDQQIFTLTFATGNGFEEIAYQLHYVINENNELDDIEILDSKKIIDEIGNAVRYDNYHLYIDDPVTVTYKLCYPYSCSKEYKAYVTEKFESKFVNYSEDGIVKDDKYLIFGEVYQDNENKNVCYAEFLDVDFTKTYKITYTLNEKGYIDDANVELIKKEVTKDPNYVKDFYEGYLENN